MSLTEGRAGTDVDEEAPASFGSKLADGICSAVVLCAILALRFGYISVRQPAWLVALIAVVVALSAYRLRETRRFGYGAVEFALGLIFALVAFVPSPPLDLKSAASFFTAVYLMVRGLDNVRTGLSPKQRRPWDRVFRTHRTQAAQRGIEADKAALPSS